MLLINVINEKCLNTRELFASHAKANELISLLIENCLINEIKNNDIVRDIRKGWNLRSVNWT